MSLELSSPRTNPVKLVSLHVSWKWVSVNSAEFVPRNKYIPRSWVRRSPVFISKSWSQPLAGWQQCLLSNFAQMQLKMLCPPLPPKPWEDAPAWSWEGRATTSWGLDPPFHPLPKAPEGLALRGSAHGSGAEEVGEPRTRPHISQTRSRPLPLDGQAGADPSLLPFPSLSPARWPAGRGACSGGPMVPTSWVRGDHGVPTLRRWSQPMLFSFWATTIPTQGVTRCVFIWDQQKGSAGAKPDPYGSQNAVSLAGGSRSGSLAQQVQPWLSVVATIRGGTTGTPRSTLPPALGVKSAELGRRWHVRTVR